MSSREKILAAIAKNQPNPSPLPDLSLLGNDSGELLETYTATLKNIGGNPIVVENLAGIKDYIKEHFPAGKRIITSLSGFDTLAESNWQHQPPHELENVDLALFWAHFGVAENGALWLTEDILLQRAAPFIAQYLAVVLRAEDIVAHMHQAYERIGSDSYGYGVFIAGPSKTADIEQSLVIGAHGPKGLTVFIVK